MTQHSSYFLMGKQAGIGSLLALHAGAPLGSMLSKLPAVRKHPFAYGGSAAGAVLLLAYLVHQLEKKHQVHKEQKQQQLEKEKSLQEWVDATNRAAIEQDIPNWEDVWGDRTREILPKYLNHYERSKARLQANAEQEGDI